MLRIGLTGGIGSGKSTVLAMLAGHGAAALDADAISRAATGPAGGAIAAIAQTFGAEFIAADGGMDRDRMRAAVFADASARARLEAIVHPIVSAQLATGIQAAQHGHRTAVVVDIPLLVESGRWRRAFDRILVVDCDAATQIERVQRRSGLAPPQIEAILAAQATRTTRLAAADAVICNQALSLEELRAQVAELARTLGL